MKHLVTGGGGFVGRYIVERLVGRGDDVSIFCRGSYPEIEEMGVDVIRGNLKNAEDVSDAVEGHDAVFHVASKIDMWGRYDDFYEINVEGTEHVIDACLEHDVSDLIYTSSASVVFDCDDLEGVDESQPYPDKYLAPYPETKMMAEKRVRGVNGKNGLKTVILRPHLIYGPRDESLAPRFIEQGEKGKIPVIGDGDNKVDLSYVGNVADAHILALESDEAAGETYFITDDNPVNVWDFLNDLFDRLGVPEIDDQRPYRLVYYFGALNELVYKLLGKYDEEPRITRFLAAELAKSHYFDISKAKEELGYEPRVSTEEGVERYVEYYENQYEQQG
ncbi:MAG: NAD-dependent epimerase/dehydratase family protein [Halobacteria archaeon]|nr:NAD-dependent epimerase/dehydratase family protein [Halobacteria archaeon]